MTRLARELDDVRQRLESVTVENLPYDEFIRRYDTPETLFYCDPPYFGSEDYYGKGLFSVGDFSRLADLLANIKGKFILTVNDAPEMRSVFAGFDIEAAELTYTVNGENPKRVTELIVTSKNMPRRAQKALEF